jgi:hypothetical protein
LVWGDVPWLCALAVDGPGSSLLWVWPGPGSLCAGACTGRACVCRLGGGRGVSLPIVSIDVPPVLVPGAADSGSVIGHLGWAWLLGLLGAAVHSVQVQLLPAGSSLLLGGGGVRCRRHALEQGQLAPVSLAVLGGEACAWRIEPFCHMTAVMTHRCTWRIVSLHACVHGSLGVPDVH